MGVDHLIDLLTFAGHGVLINFLERRGRRIAHAFHGVFVGDSHCQHDRGVKMPLWYIKDKPGKP